MGKFRRKDQQIQQGEFWVPTAKLTRGPKDHCYARQKVLEGMDFTGQIHRLCGPHYKAGILSAGRPPTDPAVLFKIMMVGFLEGIGSDRCIAARYADSLILRRFLGYALTEKTPDHSSFTVFRQRLPAEVFQAAHEVVLDGLRAHGLLKGRHLGIDSSVIEANASLRGRANVNKRYLCGILAFNLSLIMRKLTGVGTPRQAAAARAAFLACYEASLRLRTALLLTLTLKTGTPVLILTSIPARRPAPVFSRSRSAAHFSTGSQAASFQRMEA